MSDLELLFLVLAVVYLWECACWIPGGSVVVLTWLGQRWRLRHPPALLGNGKGGFVFAAPLPPLGTLFSTAQFPLSLSNEAAFAFISSSINPGPRPPQTAILVAFAGVKTIEAQGKRVRINGTEFLKAPTPTSAGHLARMLQELRKAAPKDRGRIIEQRMKQSLDTQAIKEAWQELQKRSSTVRLLTNALFFYLFGFAPALIYQVGLAGSWIGLLIGLFTLTLTTALFFRSAHKHFYPGAEDERFTHFITILLSPATAIRAGDVLSRPLLEQFQPLAVCRVFCPESEFKKLARRFLIELRHPALPVCPLADPLARSAEENYRAVLRKHVELFLKQSGVAIDELMRRPGPMDNSSVSYCPRCESQFTTREGVCSDCGGLALIPFAPGLASPKPVKK